MTAPWRENRDSVILLGQSCWPQKWGASRREQLHENWEIAGLWAVGVLENTESWLKQIGASLRTKYKLSKNVFAVTSVALILERLGTHCYSFPRSLWQGVPVLWVTLPHRHSPLWSLFDLEIDPTNEVKILKGSNFSVQSSTGTKDIFLTWAILSWVINPITDNFLYLY